MRLMVFILTLSAITEVMAWKEPTHQLIVADAFDYMNSEYANMEQKRAYDFFSEAAGGAEQAKEILKQGAFDVDSFEDTRLGEWFIPYSRAPLGNTAIVQFTSYWHFLNMTRGEDDHGNDHGGYDYRYHTPDQHWWTDIDNFAKGFFYNLQLHPDDFATTEAHYRQGSQSDITKHYEDFQEIAWQPIDNLAKYWYEQYLSNPSLIILGYVLHVTGDVAQPHHVWVTSGNNHAGWEAWVEDHYANENFADYGVVSQLITDYDATAPLRDILTYTASKAYEHPEVLYNKDTESRTLVAKIMIPHAIACTVTVLTKTSNQFFANQQASQ